VDDLTSRVTAPQIGPWRSSCATTAEQSSFQEELAMSKAFSMGFAAIAACALFACADGDDVVDTSTASDTDQTEPTLFRDDKEETPRTADEREQLASANGATARAISFNHPEPHTLTIPALDLSSGRGGKFSLTLGGGALGERHTHDVMLSRDQLSAIRDGAELSVESGAGGSKGAHTHTVTISRR
jgi:hypothetical protein